jgi:hypothetical protein
MRDTEILDIVTRIKEDARNHDYVTDEARLLHEIRTLLILMYTSMVKTP